MDGERVRGARFDVGAFIAPAKIHDGVDALEPQRFVLPFARLRSAGKPIRNPCETGGLCNHVALPVNQLRDEIRDKFAFPLQS
jgi:hypothetical protein